MNKQIIGLVATLLMLGTALSPAPEEEKEIAFQITINKDATISISDLRTTGNAPLAFVLGRTDIHEDAALPTNVEDPEGWGHWNITNIGNTEIEIYISSTADFGTAPYLGISSKVGNSSAYVDYKYRTLDNETALEYDVDYSELGDYLPKGGNTLFFQRMAADNTATGGFSASDLKIIITSSPYSP